jgi:hypothetical protein
MLYSGLARRDAAAFSLAFLARVSAAFLPQTRPRGFCLSQTDRRNTPDQGNITDQHDNQRRLPQANPGPWQACSFKTDGSWQTVLGSKLVGNAHVKRPTTFTGLDSASLLTFNKPSCIKSQHLQVQFNSPGWFHTDTEAGERTALAALGIGT